MTGPHLPKDEHEPAPEILSEQISCQAPCSDPPTTDQHASGSTSVTAEQPTFFGLLAVLTILVIVLFTITFVVQAFRVPSESMENTLLVGDFLLADKLHFGDGSGGGSWSRVLPYRAIQHGDIVVFQSPAEDLLLVKRVIGLPGDRIHMRAGVVYRNGMPLHEDYVIHTFPYFNFYRDNFPTQLYVTADVNRNWRRNMPHYMEGGELVVPPDSYFVMGDNRDRSLDSRYWGFVPRGNVLGRPLVIYMSVTHGRDQGTRNGKLVHSGQMLAHFLQLARWDRIFHLVR